MTCDILRIPGRRAALLAAAGASAFLLAGCDTVSEGFGARDLSATLDSPFVQTEEVRTARRTGAWQPHARPVQALAPTPQFTREVDVVTGRLTAEGLIEDLLEAWAEADTAIALAEEDLPDVGLSVEDQAHIAGRATPENVVVLSVGALTTLHDDPLAALMAHELAHILLGHFTITEYQNAIYDMSYGIADAAYTAHALSARAQRRLGNVGTDEVTEQASEMAWLALAAETASDTLISSTWQRPVETRADLLAVDLLAATDHLNPRAVVYMLEQLKTQGRGAAAEMAGMTTTLEGRLGAMKLPQSVEEARERLIAGSAVVALDTVEDVRGWLARGHEDLDARIVEVNRYINRFYPDTEPFHPPADAPGAASDPDLQRHMRAGQLARNAALALGRDAPDQAATLASQATRLSGDGRHPLARAVWSSASARKGDMTGARQHLETAMEDRNPPPGIYRMLASHHAARGRTDLGLALLDEAITRYQDARPFVLTKVAILRNAGREAEAQAVLATCHTAACEERKTRQNIDMALDRMDQTLDTAGSVVDLDTGAINPDAATGLLGGTRTGGGTGSAPNPVKSILQSLGL